MASFDEMIAAMNDAERVSPVSADAHHIAQCAREDAHYIAQHAREDSDHIVKHMWIIFVLLPVVLAILFMILKP